MMEEKLSQELAEEFQTSLHRPLTEEEINFLDWVGEKQCKKAHASEKKNTSMETFV
ncbi:hypothetical protein [Salicibibacter kimchii]|uniref:hypothetical protein n=1 Tax=Salicibibacter kimchii TaxID=2099786 RepID=UPI00135C9048|nr:hypothetical protein [Salicibibacter kimchii]